MDSICLYEQAEVFRGWTLSWSPQALSDLSYVGNILIFCVGLNITGLLHIRVANLLPALAIATAWSWVF